MSTMWTIVGCDGGAKPQAPKNETRTKMNTTTPTIIDDMVITATILSAIADCYADNGDDTPVSICLTKDGSIVAAMAVNADGNIAVSADEIAGWTQIGNCRDWRMTNYDDMPDEIGELVDAVLAGDIARDVAAVAVDLANCHYASEFGDSEPDFAASTIEGELHNNWIEYDAKAIGIVRTIATTYLQTLKAAMAE